MFNLYSRTQFTPRAAGWTRLMLGSSEKVGPSKYRCLDGLSTCEIKSAVSLPITHHKSIITALKMKSFLGGDRNHAIH